MKFQDPSMHNSNVTGGIKSVTHTHGQAKSNMPQETVLNAVSTFSSGKNCSIVQTIGT